MYVSNNLKNEKLDHMMFYFNNLKAHLLKHIKPEFQVCHWCVISFLNFDQKTLSCAHIHTGEHT